VREVLQAMKIQDDRYTEMIKTMASAFMVEKEAHNYQLAEKRYMKTIEMADSFGPFAEQIEAIGYMGLSRIYKAKGLKNEARRYARKAADHSVYSFIIDE